MISYGRRPKRNERESAYVSRKRTWRALPEPSSQVWYIQVPGLKLWLVNLNLGPNIGA